MDKSFSHSNQRQHSKECGKEQCLIHTRIGDKCSCWCHK